MDKKKLYQIILTRPDNLKHNELELLLSKENYQVKKIPCLTIESCYKYLAEEVYNQDYNKLINNITNSQIIIFVSVNAVENFVKLINHLKSKVNFDLSFANKQVFAIGDVTAGAIARNNILDLNEVIYPKDKFQQKSEDFVKLKQLTNINNKSVLIVRGDTSREYIYNYLVEQSARVEELIVYQTSNPSGIIRASDLDGAADKVIVTITSNSILENFYNKLDSKIKLDITNNSWLIVASSRIAEKAQQLGFQNIYITNTMDSRTYLSYIKKIIDNN